jgi:hypothetical protein
MKNPDRHALLFWIAALALGAGCLLGASEEDVKARFRSTVDGANQCQQASDCALASVHCPLGCFAAVRADRKAEVERVARELVADYERGGAHCDYECVPPGPLTCTAGRCAADPNLDGAVP